MVEYLLEQWNQLIYTLAGNNEMMAAGISVYILGTASYIFRNIPGRLWRFIKRQTTISITFNNGGWEHSVIMNHFINWVDPRIIIGLSKTLSINPKENARAGASVVGIGYGIHFFFYKHRLYWIRKETLESSGSERQKEQISVYTLGRNLNALKRLAEAFLPKPDEKHKTWVYRMDADGDWERYTAIPKADLSKLAMDPKFKQTLIDQISHFKENRDWYYDRHLAYKLSYILHGPPGTGKTSLIKAIAAEFNMNLCIINIHSASDKMLEHAMSQVPSNSIVVVEDFDSCSATKTRSASDKGVMSTSSNDVSFLTLSGFLNVLDGVHALDNCIVFLTTNHLDYIDPAVYRKGRIDYIYELGPVPAKEVRKYTAYLFPENDITQYKFSDTKGCILHEAVLVAKDDFDVFIDVLKENEAVSES